MAAGAEESSLGQSGQQQERQNWWQKCTKGTRELWSEVKAINRQPMYLANNWGFVPVQAALGVFTFWGPKASTIHHQIAFPLEFISLLECGHLSAASVHAGLYRCKQLPCHVCVTV